MNHADNLRSFANNFPDQSVEARGLRSAADEIERLRMILRAVAEDEAGNNPARFVRDMLNLPS